MKTTIALLIALFFCSGVFAACADDPGGSDDTNQVMDQVDSVPTDLLADTAEDSQADTTEDSLADTAEDSQADTTEDTQADTTEDSQADIAEDSQADTTEDTQADTTTSDVSLSSCDEVPAQSCLSNGDCEDTERCDSFSDTLELRCCVAGQRGSGVVGAECDSDADCAHGRCFERDDGEAFCSGDCTGGLECPGFMSCSDIFHWCVPKDSGWIPESCFEIDADQCFYNDNCDDTFRCENVATAANEVFCCLLGDRGSQETGQSCSSELDCVFGRCMDGLCSDVCDYDNESCPGNMECNYMSGYCMPL